MVSQERSISRRTFLKATGMGLASATLAACVQAPVVQVESPADAAPSQVAESLNVLVVGDPFQFALERVNADFTEETSVDINFESLAYDALNARLVTAFVSGESDADVVTVDQMWNGQYKDNGWILALDDFIRSDEDTNIQDFIPEVLYSLNTWRGNIVTLPIAAYGQGVIYRTDLFEEQGLTAPPSDEADAGDWTWAKYMEIVGQINGTQFGDKDMFGTVMVGAQPVPVVHMYTQLAASRGVRWFTSFPEAPWDFTPTINTPENAEALNAYKSLYEMSPPEAINYVWFDAGTRYSQGDIGIFFWWTPYFYLVWNNGYMSGELSSVKDTTGVGLLPRWDDVPNVTSLGGWSLGIPSTTNHRDDAWRYVKWATSAETQKKMGQVPDYNFQFSDFARVSNYEDADLQAIYPYLDTQLKIMRQGNGKVVRPPMPTYSTLEGIYGLHINRALSGSATAEDALAEVDLTWQNILKGNFMIPYQLESFDDTLENTQALIDDLAG